MYVPISLSLLFHSSLTSGIVLPLQLSPNDDELMKVHTRYRDEQANLASSVGGANALAMAGALADDEPSSKAASSTTAAATASTSAPAPTPLLAQEVPAQKISLLRALLSIGDISHSLFILAQFPFLVPAYLELSDLLLRLLSESIRPAYDSISVTKRTGDFGRGIRTTRDRFSTVSKSIVKPARTTEYLSGRALSRPDSNKDYVFFFAEWKDRLPRCEGWEDSLEVLEVYLPFIGVFISQDFSLLTKICRILVKDFEVCQACAHLASFLVLW